MNDNMKGNTLFKLASQHAKLSEKKLAAAVLNVCLRCPLAKAQQTKEQKRQWRTLPRNKR